MLLLLLLFGVRFPPFAFEVGHRHSLRHIGSQLFVHFLLLKFIVDMGKVELLRQGYHRLLLRRRHLVPLGMSSFHVQQGQIIYDRS